VELGAIKLNNHFALKAAKIFLSKQEKRKKNHLLTYAPLPYSHHPSSFAFLHTFLVYFANLLQIVQTSKQSCGTQNNKVKQSCGTESNKAILIQTKFET
jgi:hypothetical protein